MSDVQVAALISEIKRLLWQQEWDSALAKCQEAVDSPQADEQAVHEVQTLRQSIEIKARAESTIRQTLDAVAQALKEPSPNYGVLLDRLQRALDLGKQHLVQRWQRQVLDRMEDVRRRQDIHARFDADHKQFREALDAGDNERALEIAQRLLDDALMHQQPAMADSAREWMRQVGEKVRLEHIANSIYSALEREDFSWACDLFERLPSTYRRYHELAPLVDDARSKLSSIEQELKDAEKRWEEGRPNETAMILGGLRRAYNKNRLWRPLWRRFHYEQASEAGEKGDEAAERRDYIKAGQAYRRAEMAYGQLLGVFEEDQTLGQSKEKASSCKSICESLAEAADALERGDLLTARAACRRAIERMERADPDIKDATQRLQQHALQFVQSLDLLEPALDELKAIEASPDTDTNGILNRVDRILALGPILPASFRHRAEDLRARAQARQLRAQDLLRVARENKTADPDKAAEAYKQSWSLEGSPELKEEIKGFLFAMAAQESDHERRRRWLDDLLWVDPEDERAKAEILLHSLRGPFEQEFLPLHIRLETLERQPEPQAADLNALERELVALADKFEAVSELLSDVRQEQTRLGRLTHGLKQAQSTIKGADQKTKEGKWEEAIGLLRETADRTEPESQRVRLRAAADRLTSQWEQAREFFRRAHESFSEALRVHQAAVDTRDYGTAPQLLRICAEHLKAAFSKLDGQPPVEWRQFEQDLEAFERRAQAIQAAWEASLNPNQPLAELVKELRRQDSARPDPVMTSLIGELAQRAVSECIAKADRDEKDGYDERASEALQTALELGCTQSEVRDRLKTLKERTGRRMRIAELRNEIRTHLNRSGGLRRASGLQTDLLRLTVEDTGRREWIEAVEKLIAAIPSGVEDSLRVAVDRHLDTGADVSQELMEFRSQYSGALRTAKDELERLRQLLQGAGGDGERVLGEGESWFSYKEQLRLYTMAYSSAAVGAHVQAAKDFERLKNTANPDAPEYVIYEEQFDQACQAVLAGAQDSAKKRLAEAQAASEGGFYQSARESLKDIIETFYEPIERELPALRARLNEPGTPLGDIRIETRKRLLEAERLSEVVTKLEEARAEAQTDWNAARAAAVAAEKARDALRRPEADHGKAQEELRANLEAQGRALREALVRIEGAELDDPDRRCFRQWQQLDKLAEQIRAYQAEAEAAEARRVIRETEIEMLSARTEDDYQALRLRLQSVYTDALDGEDMARHKQLLEKLEAQTGLPALLRLADQELQRDHFAEAQSYYESALAIRSDLGRDPSFAQKYRQARERAQNQSDIESKVRQAIERMNEPGDAVRLLEQAFNTAEQLGFSPQVEMIRLLIYRARAREALDLSEKALRTHQDTEARRKAEMALRFAEMCSDEASRKEAEHILGEVENRHRTVWLVVQEANRLMEDRKWDQAKDLLRTLPAEDPLVGPILEKAESGRREAQKIEREIQALIEDGCFDEAHGRLTQARIALDISDGDAERLRQGIQGVEDRMSSWTSKIESVVHNLASADGVRMADIESAIIDAQGVAADSQIVKGLRDQASELARSLAGLKKELERVTKAVKKAEQLSPDWLACLEALQDIPETLPLQFRGSRFEIRHCAAGPVREKRREALTRQLAMWRSQIKSLDDLPDRTLQDLLKKCTELKGYTSDPAELAQLDDMVSRIELAVEKRQTEELCRGWEAQLAEAQQLQTVGEVRQALSTMQAVQASVEAQKNRTHTQAWPMLNAVSESAVRLMNALNEQRQADLEQVMRRAQEAVGENREGIIRSEQECEQLLQDPQLSASNRIRVEAMRQELSRAKEDLKTAEESLARAKGELRLRKYALAVETLASTSMYPLPLRPQWEALSKVASELDRTVRLLEADADLMADATSLTVQVGVYKDALQRCHDLGAPWPAVLSADMWARDLQSEVELLGVRVRRALCIVVGRLVNLFLNDSNPEEAERWTTLARTEGWVTDDQQDSVKDMEHETAVVRATLSVEGALMHLDSGVAQASQTLADLLKAARATSSLRRERAVGLLRLVEAHELLRKGQVDASEQLLSDPRLMSWFPAVFSMIGREVNSAKKDRAVVEGLTEHASKLVYVPHGAEFGDVSVWLPELKRRASEGDPVLSAKLQAVRDRVRDEVNAARERGDYDRLKALNVLAQELGLAEPDIAGLESERKRTLQEAVQEANEALSAFAPEEAEPHIEKVKRLSGKDQDEHLELNRNLQAVRRICEKVDKLIQEAEVCIARYDYDSAVKSYHEASKLAPKRKRVRNFEDVQHQVFSSAFERAAGQEDFPQALEIADHALKFGFRAGDWLQAKRDLEEQRDRKITDLVRRAAGAAWTVSSSAERWGGELGDPDADLDRLQRDLEIALAWQPGSDELQQLVREVERRQKGIGDVRLDMRNGWLKLEHGEYALALQSFSAAQARLEIEHPEITRWLRFTRMTYEAAVVLASAAIDVEPLPGGGYQVVCPGWDKAEEQLTGAAHVFAEKKRSRLLGEAGESEQQQQHRLAEARRRLAQSIRQQMRAMQRCYDEGSWSEAKQHIDGATENLKALRERLSTGVLPVPDQAETREPVGSAVEAERLDGGYGDAVFGLPSTQPSGMADQESEAAPLRTAIPDTPASVVEPASPEAIGTMVGSHRANAEAVATVPAMAEPSAPALEVGSLEATEETVSPQQPDAEAVVTAPPETDGEAAVVEPGSAEEMGKTIGVGGQDTEAAATAHPEVEAGTESAQETAPEPAAETAETGDQREPVIQPQLPTQEELDHFI